MSRRRFEDADRAGDAEDRRDADAEVGETRVVDVQPGETRVVDVQLGQSRVADARQDRPAAARTPQVRPEPSATAATRLRWDAVTVTEEASATGRQPFPAVRATTAPDGGPVEHAPADRVPVEHVPADRLPAEHAPVDRQPTADAPHPLAEAPPAPADRASSVRHGAADPVKALMHRHRELCERAVDPLEIAAGLEAHGVTDRTAAHFRHRDVFSLAEEMYARVPRADDPAPPAQTPSSAGTGAAWAVLALLPGLLCAAAVAGLRYTDGRPRLAVTVGGVLAVALGLRAALGRGPLHTVRDRSPAPSTRAWTCWLLAYALLGDGLLTTGLTGGPDGPPTGGPDSPWPIALASVLALTAACGPAAWCAHLFAVRARRRLATSRALEDFATSVRPLLLGVFALFLCALGGLLALSGAVLDEPVAHAGAGALGALLLLARLLTVHGSPRLPAAVLTLAGTGEAMALLSVFAGRLPGCEAVAVPVRTVADAWGAGAIPALVCGAAALVLLLHASRTLTRASAHAVRGDAP